MGLSTSSFWGFVAVTSVVLGASGARAEVSLPADAQKALIDEGERARLAGDLPKAAAAFARARGNDLSNEPAARGACLVAIDQERQNSLPNSRLTSTEPCRAAMKLDTSPENLRNMTLSQMSQRQPPALDDLVLASLEAETAFERGPGQPWGYLARCDIGRRMGSADVLEGCLGGLRQLGLKDAATSEAFRLASPRVPLGIWALRLLVLGLFAGTLLHFLRGRRRAHERLGASGRPASVAIAMVFAISCFAWSPARAASEAPTAAKIPTATPAARVPGKAPALPPKDHLSRIVIDDAHPEASIPSQEDQIKGPLQFGYYIQDLAQRALQASQKGNHARSARYFKALTLATPTSPVGPRGLCLELRALGDNANAIQACRTAMIRPGATMGDYAVFVRTVLEHKGAMPSGERKELDDAIALVAGEKDQKVLAATLRCEVALRFEDTPLLEQCSGELAKAIPNDPLTVSFQWALAMQRHDRGEAERLVNRARELGMKEAGVAMMAQRTAELPAPQRKKLVIAIIVAVAAFAAAFYFFTLRKPAGTRAAA